MAKYKFVLELPNGVEVDSVRDVAGKIDKPGLSEEDTILHKGLFDTYEEAKKYASNLKIYRYILNCCLEGYDSYYNKKKPRYFLSIFETENAACKDLGISPAGEIYCEHPDDYSVETIGATHPGAYRYILYHKGECVYNSMWDDIFFYDYDEAMDAAWVACNTYEIEIYDAYKIDTVEVKEIRIVGIEEEEERKSPLKPMLNLDLAPVEEEDNRWRHLKPVPEGGGSSSIESEESDDDVPTLKPIPRMVDLSPVEEEEEDNRWRFLRPVPED